MDLQKIAADAGVSIDEVRERWLSLRVALWKSDFRRFAKEAVRIRTKSGDLEPLELNEAQLILHNAAEEQLADEQWVRLAGLKGRRQGFSTYVAARGYWRATLWDRQKVYILSHEMASSNVLFDMTALMQPRGGRMPRTISPRPCRVWMRFEACGASYGASPSSRCRSRRARARFTDG
jgi:hypothetical protein